MKVRKIFEYAENKVDEIITIILVIIKLGHHEYLYKVFLNFSILLSKAVC